MFVNVAYVLLCVTASHDVSTHAGASNGSCLALDSPAPCAPGLSAKEAAALEYADGFAHLFRDRYPHRRPLYLAPLNEAGVRKLACTCYLDFPLKLISFLMPCMYSAFSTISLPPFTLPSVLGEARVRRLVAYSLLRLLHTLHV